MTSSTIDRFVPVLLLLVCGTGAALAQPPGSSKAIPAGSIPYYLKSNHIKATLERLEMEIDRLSALVEAIQGDPGLSANQRLRLLEEYERIAELKRQSLLQWKQTATDPEQIPAYLEAHAGREPGPQSQPEDPLPERIRKRRAYNSDPRMKKTPADMFSFLDISPQADLPSLVDKRALFPEVRIQGRTLACAAFAIAAAMEAFPGVSKDLSEAYIYGLLRRAAQPEDEALDDLGVERVSDALEVIRAAVVPEEGECPWEGRAAPAELIKIKGATYRLTDHAGMVIGPGFTDVADIKKTQLLQRLVDAGFFPLVTLSSSSLIQEEDWVEFYRSSVGHVFLVIGYGTGPSPFPSPRQSEPKPYFLIRNSLTGTAHQVHQKIRAQNLYDFLKNIDVIRKAEKVD